MKSTWSPGPITQSQASLSHELWKVPQGPRNTTAPSRPPPGLTNTNKSSSTWSGNSLGLDPGWSGSYSSGERRFLHETHLQRTHSLCNLELWNLVTFHRFGFMCCFSLQWNHIKLSFLEKEFPCFASNLCQKQPHCRFCEYEHKKLFFKAMNLTFLMKFYHFNTPRICAHRE